MINNINMKYSNNFKQINWVDGMKINKDHFIGLENYFISRIRGWRGSMTDAFNYGLLPAEGGYEQTVNFIPDIDNQKLRVRLINCQAVTPSGYWIDISDDSQGKEGENTGSGVELSLDLSELEEGDYYLVLSVDPFARVAVGQVSSTENPLRFPYVMPEYTLRMASVETGVKGKLDTDSIIIGKFAYRNNRTEVISDYVPPCASIQSHPILIKFYEYLIQELQALEQNIIALIAEINIRESSNILTETIHHLAGVLLMFLSANATEYRWYLKNKPPVLMVDWAVTLAKIIKNELETRTAEEKEKLLNYFYDQFDINPSKFKQLLDNTINVEYDHDDINHALEKSEEFLKVISTLFNELKKMEFIVGGKRKTKSIDIVIK